MSPTKTIEAKQLKLNHAFTIFNNMSPDYLSDHFIKKHLKDTDIIPGIATSILLFLSFMGILVVPPSNTLQSRPGTLSP